MPEQITELPCLYCRKIGNRSKEHIVPQALGGKRKLPKSIGICGCCNNGILSILDQELCNRSFLSVIASREIDRSIWQTWDVDHRNGGVFIEASPLWKGAQLSSFVAYPQIVFEKDGPQFRGDAEEVMRFGNDNFYHLVLKSIKRCFERFRHGEKKRIHFEPITVDLINFPDRFPPRAFFRHTLQEIAKKPPNSYILRYCTQQGKRHAIRELSRLGERNFSSRHWSVSPSSRMPRIAIEFDGEKVLRGLAKLGLNLIAHTCNSTNLRNFAFQPIIRLILGQDHVQRHHLAQFGFVPPELLASLEHSQKRSHRFRLCFLAGQWLVYSSYFNGSIASFARFPGASNESWKTVDIEMSLETGEFVENRKLLHLPILNIQTEWEDSRRLCPSIEMNAYESKFAIEYKRERRQPVN